MIILAACTLQAKGSSSSKKHKTPEYQFLKTCAAGVKEYGGLVFIQCSQVARQVPNPVSGLNRLVDSCIWKMLRQEVKKNICGSCSGVNDCNNLLMHPTTTVCIKLVDPKANNAHPRSDAGITITKQGYAELKESNKLPFTYKRHDFHGYYELLFGSKPKRMQLPEYYFTFECEDCNAVKNCVFQDMAVDYHKDGYRQEWGTGKLTLITESNYSYTFCTIMY